MRGPAGNLRFGNAWAGRQRTQERIGGPCLSLATQVAQASGIWEAGCTDSVGALCRSTKAVVIAGGSGDASVASAVSAQCPLPWGAAWSDAGSLPVCGRTTSDTP